MDFIHPESMSAKTFIELVGGDRKPAWVATRASDGIIDVERRLAAFACGAGADKRIALITSFARPGT